jgi:hypothetical protein
VLKVPTAGTGGSDRIKLDPATTYDEVLAHIYEIVGCASVSKKPGLQYRLSSSTMKSDAINLGSEQDWEGCLKDVVVAEAKKKRESQLWFT